MKIKVNIPNTTTLNQTITKLKQISTTGEVNIIRILPKQNHQEITAEVI